MPNGAKVLYRNYVIMCVSAVLKNFKKFPVVCFCVYGSVLFFPKNFILHPFGQRRGGLWVPI